MIHMLLILCLAININAFIPTSPMTTFKKMNKLSMTEYEAQLNPEAFAGIAASTVFLYAASQIWANDIVPQKRTELAKSKAKGEVRELLDTIRESDDNEMQLERWFFNDWLKKEKKSAAVPFLKKAKWNSGDNPVLVAFAAIFSCVIAASAFERVF